MLPGTCVVVFTDGVLSAGERTGQSLDLPELIRGFLDSGLQSVEDLAGHIVEAVLRVDQGRPADDASVLVVAITEDDSDQQVRRLKIRFPIGS